MRSHLLALGAAVLLMLIVIHLSDSERGPADIERGLIDSVRTGFAAAYAAGDVEALLAYYDEDYLDMSVGAETRGKEGMRRAFEETFAEWDGALEVHPQEVLVQGDWAIERGSFTIQLTHRATGVKAESRRRYLEVLVRRKDGRWHIFRDLDNEQPVGPG